MSAFSDPHKISVGVVVDNYMSIDAAAEYSGYNPRYFRKLMRSGAIEGIKIGQVWLVRISSLWMPILRICVYLETAIMDLVFTRNTWAIRSDNDI